MKLPADYRRLTPYQRRKVRLAYIEQQGGLCHFCKKPLSGPPHPRVQSTHIPTAPFPEGFFKFPVHLHHNHHTGMTIGAVHARCNAYLFIFCGE